MAREHLKNNNGLIDDICYDSWWLPKDMENMGYIFEYCDKYCNELYRVKIDKLKFIDAFMRSKFRFEMETGHPRLLSQAAKDSVEMFIDVDNNSNCRKFELKSGENNFCYHQLYWIGWMYAYIHFREKLLSTEIIKILPLKLMLEHYYLGHEMSKEAYYEKIKHLFN